MCKHICLKAYIALFGDLQPIYRLTCRPALNFLLKQSDSNICMANVIGVLYLI